jgi:hypothetical protein
MPCRSETLSRPGFSVSVSGRSNKEQPRPYMIFFRSREVFADIRSTAAASEKEPAMGKDKRRHGRKTRREKMKQARQKNKRKQQRGFSVWPY